MWHITSKRQETDEVTVSYMPFSFIQVDPVDDFWVPDITD